MAKLTSMHFYSWKRGLKTGMYYLRTRPKADAIQFTVDMTALAATKANDLGKDNADAAAAAAADALAAKVKGGEAMALDGKATRGLDYAAEPACENCSA